MWVRFGYAAIVVTFSLKIAYADDPANPFPLRVYDTQNKEGVVGSNQDFIIRLASLFDAGLRLLLCNAR